MNNFFGRLGILESGLNASWLRNKIIGNNIANAQTPNFKASKLEFEGIIKDQISNGGSTLMKATRKNHIATSSVREVKPVIKTRGDSSMTLDGNNVDLENEMTDLAKNSLLYQALIQKTSKEISRIKYAINEGKR